MPALQLIRNTFFVALFLLTSLLCGCGGGGGSAQSGTLFDPAAKYQGNSAQAVLTADNAEALVMGSLNGEGFGAAISAIGDAEADAAVQVEQQPALQLTGTLKAFARQLAIPKNAAKLRENAVTAAQAKGTRASSFQVQGTGGGVASYSLQINEETGSFYGTVTCTRFTSNNTVMNGTSEVLGSFDLNRQELSTISLSFKSLSFNSLSDTPSGYAYTLAGALSWSFAYASSTENLMMNMVVKDGTSSKTYWFKEYLVSTTYGSNSQSHTISGRYYDHDHGYVQVSTRNALVVYNGGPRWPGEGALDLAAAGGKWARITFQPTLFNIEADTNGDGVPDWQVEHLLAFPPLPIAPPVADAGADQDAAQNILVRLDGSASSDPNGDVLSYDWSFISAPPGSSFPALAGHNTATPTFTTNAVGTYRLRLRVYDGYFSSEDFVTVTVIPTVPTHPTALKQTWQFGNYGSSIGQAGLLTTDLDGDGTPEIIAGASLGGFGDNVIWYVVRKNASGGYDQVWRSENYRVTIAKILLADMNADGRSDVVVGLNNGSVRCYDGPTLQEISQVQVAAGLRDLAVADLEGDGKTELVTTDGAALRVYDAATGTLKWNQSSSGGVSLAVGSLDGDAGLEIVTTNYGGKGFVLNGATGAVKWEYLNGFGVDVKLADLDGDGKDEIVGASAWYKITIFDADLKSPAWEITTDLDIGALLLADTDGDKIPEILYGDSQWGDIHAIDARTHQRRWAVPNPEHGVAGIAFGDVDLDGKSEVLWGAGGSSTGPDFLFIADPATDTIKWQNLDFAGLSPLAVGDLNNDGSDQLLVVTQSSNSGYDGGIIHVFDAKSHALSTQKSLEIMDWLGGHRVVRVADLNGDGRSEFALSTSNTYDAFIRVYDAASRTLIGQTPSYDGNFFSTMAVGDVDGDGKMEIVAGQGRAHTGAKGVYLVVFDGTTFAEKWKSVDLGSYWGGGYDLKLADLDRDGGMDIIASVDGDRLVVYDGATHVLKVMVATPARALEVADVDGDGYPEILVGRSDGLIDVYNGVSFEIKSTISTFSTAAVDALKVADLDGNGTGKLLVASDGILTVLDGQELCWRSGYLDANIGRANSIEVKDTDHDGRPNIIIGGDTVLYQFKYLGTGSGL